MKRSSWMSIVAVGLLVGGCGLETGGEDLESYGGGNHEEEIELRDLQTGDFVAGSEGELERDRDELEGEIETEGLPANTDIFMVWAIFNDPSACTNGNPVTGSPCGPADLGIDATGATVIFYSFENSGPNGELDDIERELDVGDTSGCLEGLPCRDGLTNPRGAEVHIVLIENDTGTFLQGAQFIP